MKQLASEFFRIPAPSSRIFSEAAMRLLHARHLAAYHWSIPYVAGQKVLEIGPHDGHGTEVLIPYVSSIIGLDINLQLITQAKNKLSIPFVLADGQHIPIESESFDACIAFQLIEHVKNDRVLLVELRRILRPGGLLLLSTPQKNTRLLSSQKPWNPEHVREYDEDEWCELMSSAFRQFEVLALFGDDMSHAIELCRVWQDPWPHYFQGSFSKPMRIFGKFFKRILRYYGIRKSDLQSNAFLLLDEDPDKLRSRFLLGRSNLYNALDLLSICKKDVRQSNQFSNH